jgi:hypothetical protein
MKSTGTEPRNSTVSAESPEAAIVVNTPKHKHILQDHSNEAKYQYVWEYFDFRVMYSNVFFMGRCEATQDLHIHGDS